MRSRLGVILALICVLSVGGASAAMATPVASTTPYAAPVLVPGAPAGVTGDSIEYGGVLITTVRHADTSFTIESFDGTTFTVLTDQFLDATNFTLYNDMVVFSAQVAGGWELYLYDGTTFTRANATNDLLTDNPQEIAFLTPLLVFTAEISGSVILIGWDGVVDHVGFLVTTGEAISGLQTFNDALVLNVTTAGVSDVMFLGVGSSGLLQANMACDVGVVWADLLYRSCGNDTDGYSLWALTAEGGFTQVPGSPLEPGSLTVFGGALYFTGLNGLAERLLYSFDGSVIAEVSAPPAAPVFPDELVVVGDTLMMRVGDYPGSPLEGIVSFDGSAFAAVPGAGGVAGAPYQPRGLISFGGSLYFTGTAVPDGETRSFWRVSVAVPAPEPELAATGMSVGGESASLMAGLLAGGLLLAGLGVMALRRRGLGRLSAVVTKNSLH
jgi:hypothetical protein